MARVALNEDNRAFLMDMVKKFELDKKLKEEGLEEAALSFLKLGVDEKTVSQGTGLTMEQVLEIKKKLL